MTRSDLLTYITTELDSTLTECKSQNPLEAWSMFIDRLDIRVRRRIGDELERGGKNRYTGIKQETK